MTSLSFQVRQWENKILAISTSNYVFIFLYIQINSCTSNKKLTNLIMILYYYNWTHKIQETQMTLKTSAALLSSVIHQENQQKYKSHNATFIFHPLL